MKVAQLFKLRMRRSQVASLRHIRGFTLLELLIVISVIIILAGLTIATIGYVQKKGARSRAEAEIAAMSAALESYKADNGVYPSNSDTNSLDPITNTDSVKNDKSKYEAASKILYAELSGDRNFDGTVTDADKVNPSDALPKTYFAFKPPMLQRSNMSADVGAGNPVQALRDPFGNSYGYSTVKAANPTGTAGYNPTFDLWSTIGSTDANTWVKNW